jgi:hypothetical protein
MYYKCFEQPFGDFCKRFDPTYKIDEKPELENDKINRLLEQIVNEKLDKKEKELSKLIENRATTLIKEVVKSFEELDAKKETKYSKLIDKMENQMKVLKTKNKKYEEEITKTEYMRNLRGALEFVRDQVITSLHFIILLLYVNRIFFIIEFIKK